MPNAFRPVSLLIALTIAALALAACSGDGGDDTPPTPTPRAAMTEAEARTFIETVSLTGTDIGADYTQAVDRCQTNDEAAAARPDTENARSQFEEWGQVFACNVRWDAPPNADLLFNAKTAQMMNSVTVFESPEGATASLEFFRALPEDIVSDFITGGDSSALSDTRVQKDIEFTPKGDESFAWRVSGKATLEGGFVVNYVADVVFVRSGEINGNVTTVALGQAPDRTELEGLVDTFLARIASERG